MEPAGLSRKLLCSQAGIQLPSCAVLTSSCSRCWAGLRRTAGDGTANRLWWARQHPRAQAGARSSSWCWVGWGRLRTAAGFDVGLNRPVLTVIRAMGVVMEEKV